MLNDWHEIFFSILHVNFFKSIFTCLPSKIYGQVWHCLPQFVIPFTFLFGYFSIGAGTLDLINIYGRFGCLWNAVNGGPGKHSFKYLSCVFIDLQCLATMG